MIQINKGDADDVGDISEVKIATDSGDGWSPQWIKINTNSFETGLGNGIFYTTITKTVDKDHPLSLKRKTGKKCKDEPCLEKCEAHFCMRSEKRFLSEGLGEPPSDLATNKAWAYGPLGEGLPGTQQDHTLFHGHFMREFFQMQHMDDDDEDFLRTHAF